MPNTPNRKRNKAVSFRLTQDEYDRLMRNVDASGLSLSAYAIEKLIKQNTTIINTDGLTEVAAAVRRVGVNINQLARKANSGELVCRDEIVQMKGEFDEVWQQLKQLHPKLL